MPSIRDRGYRLIVNTRDERGHIPHVHVLKAGQSCKVSLVGSFEFSDIKMRPRDAKIARALVRKHFIQLMDWWHRYND